MASHDWLEKDFYKTLGVSKSVSDQDLKKKYRKLSRKYHPDMNPDDSAAEAKYKEISEAYAVLSDPQQRTEYDKLRAMGEGGARFASGGHGGFEDMFGQGFGGAGGHYSFQTGGGSGFEDIFGGLFGGPAPGPRRGEDVTAKTTLDLETALAGSTVTVQSTVGKPKQVKIPPGIKDGQRLKVKNEGMPSPDGGRPGDLILTVQVRKHPVFERDGNNLRMTLPITFTEAVNGSIIEVPMVGNSTVKLRVMPGTPSGRVLRVKGRGVKTKTATGDLLAEVQIVVPSKLDDKQQQAIDAWSEVEPDDDPRADLKSRIR